MYTSQLIDEASAKQEYLDFEQLRNQFKKIKNQQRDYEKKLQLICDITELRQNIFHQLEQKLFSKLENRIAYYAQLKSSLKEHIQLSLKQYIKTYLAYADNCLRIFSYSILDNNFIAESKNIKSIPFENIIGISVDMIIEDSQEIAKALSSIISNQYLQKFINNLEVINKNIFDRMICQKIYQQALNVFVKQEEAEKWLSTPKARLEGKTPLEALETDEGAVRVEEILYQAEYGMIA